MAGMGLSGFLGNNPGGGSRRGSFLNWKDGGSAIVWLHTQADIHFAFNHQFMVEDEFEDKETKKTKQVLRFPRFVSPEPIEVLQKQYFRDKATDRLEHMPNLDPFLLLREWIRVQVRTGALAPETVVFEWFDPKNNQIIQWHAGDLSGLEKRAKNRWNHSLDAKLQYVMLVVDDANPGAGVQIAQETQALGDKLREEIKRQMESRGDEVGNPTIEPYAFKWRFDKNAKNPNDVYGCFRYDKAVCTDEVWNLIAQTEPQDVSRLIHPQEGDADKVRAAFEQAQRIDLPIDLIFSSEAQDRRAAAEGLTSGAPPAQRRTPAQQPGQRPGGQVPASTGGPRRPGTQGAPQGGRPAGGGGLPAQAVGRQGAHVTGQRGGSPQASSPAPAGGTGPQTRRRRVEEPKPTPPPAADTIPCDECGHPMDPSDTTCANCGATYDVTPDEGAPPPKPMSSGPRRPPTAQQQRTDAAQDVSNNGHTSGPCWSCGSADISFDTGHCNACGMSQDVNGAGDDDIPF